VVCGYRVDFCNAMSAHSASVPTILKEAHMTATHLALQLPQFVSCVLDALCAHEVNVHNVKAVPAPRARCSDRLNLTDRLNSNRDAKTVQLWKWQALRAN
jgi:hypothetical protein